VTPIVASAFLLVLIAAACGSDNPGRASPLMLEPETGDFFFQDASGNRVIYQRLENTLIVEPDIDVDQLALAYCAAEAATDDPARFSAVGLVLAEAVIPFIDTVDRLCDR